MIAEQLKKAIKDSELSASEISRHTGITVGQICRFIKGERSLTISTADVLLQFFGLEIKGKKVKSRHKTRRQLTKRKK